MRYYSYIVVVFLLLNFTTNSQNLVPNPSFEEYTPYQGEWCAGIAGFDTIVDHWESFSITPDYFNSCVNDEDPNSGVPLNAWGWQYPVSGEAYASLFTYTHSFDEDREYIACPLLEPLEVGENYYTMFYISSYDGGEISNLRCATNRFGAKFFTDRKYGTGNFGDYPRYWPQNESDVQYNEFVTDSANWTLVEGWFTADSAYSWLALGNFFDDAHTDTVQLGESDVCYAYYFIDNVCVTKNPAHCNYLVNIKALNKEIEVSLFPNPSTSTTSIISEDLPIQNVEVYNSIGKRILSSNCSSSPKFSINTQNWPSGLYFFHVKISSQQITTLKFLKL